MQQRENRLGRVKSIGVLMGVLYLAPAYVLAAGAGPPEGIEALEALMYVLMGLFAIAWLIVWAILRHFSKRKNSKKPAGSKEKYWLFNGGIPVGLRLLSLFQFLISFAYAMVGLLVLFSRSSSGGDHGPDLHIAMFSFILSPLMIITANGYVRRSIHIGYDGGIILSLLCLVNGLVFLYSHGKGAGMVDLLSPAYGLLLISLLIWRYEGYFRNKEI